jgi:N-acetylglucosaminyldiphosphoundecaprenol N-acetyl-beta-D-mannosaminyltransferase
MVCGGVRVDAYGFDQAVDQVIALARQRVPAAVHLCNAYTVACAGRDPSLRALLNQGDCNLPDGMPLVWALRRLGVAIGGRVYGPDLMEAVVDRGREAGLAHYLYGSTPEVVARLEQRLAQRFPGVRIAAAESPPFRPLEPGEVGLLAERVRRSGAHLVWVGLGTPKQDRFVAQHRDTLGVPLVAVGAAFDFHAGAVRQAPAWLRDRGLEWAYRLAREPRRMWRRYLLGNLRFAWTVLRRRPALVAGVAPGRGGVSP